MLYAVVHANDFCCIACELYILIRIYVKCHGNTEKLKNRSQKYIIWILIMLFVGSEIEIFRDRVREIAPLNHYNQ